MLTVLTFLFFVSFIFYVIDFSGNKYSFRYYEAGTSHKTVFETRKIPSVKGLSRMERYVEELLLGPSVQRAQPLFPLGTKVLTCFYKKNIFYLNLSEDAFFDFSPDFDFKKSFNLMEKNIKDNFKSVKKIEFFVEGRAVFDEANELIAEASK